MIPRVGDPATIHVGSDLYGATVVGVSASGFTIQIRRDDARGPLHVPNERRPVEVARRCKDGRYRLSDAGRAWRPLVTFGERVTHWDPSF